MAIPDRIPVARVGGNYSSGIGFYQGKNGRQCQYWGQVVAAFSREKRDPPKDWKSAKRWYAILHRFDENGKHLGTDHWFSGTTADGEREVCQRAIDKLDEMIAALDGAQDAERIEIGLFSVEIDGNIFGMVDVSEPGWPDRVEMKPGNLLFTYPWSGYYDT